MIVCPRCDRIISNNNVKRKKNGMVMLTCLSCNQVSYVDRKRYELERGEKK